MRPDGYRAVLTVAIFFIVLPGALLLAGEPRATAPFVVTVGALAVGVVFTSLVLAVILLSRHVGR